jgi:L-seryl-tRNA(Ser) seleniumtransferase
MDTKQELLRRLPKVDDLLKNKAIADMLETCPRRVVVDAVRSSIDAARIEIETAGRPEDAAGIVEIDSLVADTKRIVEMVINPSLRKVVNATGVVVHTNLGRSILPDVAIKAVAEIAGSYSNTEFDIDAGKRGSRHDHIEKLLCRLTGADAAMAVNNNAAAVLLALSALAKGKEVIISRGQLVEIGGSFRIPDVMRQSGARLREVGATNKTHIADFRSAVTDKTGLIMRAHPSNFQVVGFSSDVSLKDMVLVAREFEVPVLDDLGSGVMIDISKAGLPYEPTVQESVAAGVDVTTFSGDKLMGGPQAGIAVGKREFIQKMKKHPLARAVRIDKMTLAALEATLMLYYDEEKAIREIPTLSMLFASQEELAKRAKALAKRLAAISGIAAAIGAGEDTSKAGGGALPLAELPTAVIEIAPAGMSANKLEKELRRAAVPVIGRIKDDKLLLDMRTILPADEEYIVSALTEIANKK